MLAPVFLATTLLAASGSAPCAGAAPAIVSAGVKTVAQNGDSNHYTVAISIMNEGRARQPNNLLQSVDVYQNGIKVGQIGLQPLTPKQTQTVTYGFDRSADAGNGTTHLRMTLDFNGKRGSNVDCGSGSETYRLNV